MNRRINLILFCLGIITFLGCNNKSASHRDSILAAGDTLPAPLFIDPNYHGSCDPEIIWNSHEKAWWIFYTARKGTDENTWVGTPLGVISTHDLKEWEFKGYCKFDGRGGKPLADETFWAPAIISSEGIYHMFVTYKPESVPNGNPWGGSPGKIVHYEAPAEDLLNGWKRKGIIHDTSLSAIDATVYQQEDLFHVWYKAKVPGQKNELYHQVTADFENWEAKGFSKSDVFNKKVTGSGFEEAPYIFQWKDAFWLITDPHKGLFVYKSSDAKNWKFQGTILKEGGKLPMDNSRARHCSVAIIKGRAFIFYHVEPFRLYNGKSVAKQPVMNRRSVLQVAELKMEEGKIICDRNATLHIP
ncbi:MAG: family 43 glycosylhydrolase [Bacteroidota bacterium]